MRQCAFWPVDAAHQGLIAGHQDQTLVFKTQLSVDMSALRVRREYSSRLNGLTTQRML